jgi:hypothetical protein
MIPHAVLRADAVGQAFQKSGSLLVSLVDSKAGVSDSTYRMLEQAMRALLHAPDEAQLRECVHVLQLLL